MKYVIWIVVIALAVWGIYALSQDKESNEEVLVNEYGEHAGLFESKLQEGVLARVGRPIEGIEASGLMSAFPGFIAADFENVETAGGKYSVVNNQVIFNPTAGKPANSAEEMISAEGYATLLENVAARLDVPVTSESDITIIIQKLENPAL